MSTAHRTVDGVQYLRWWAAAMVVFFHAFRLKDVSGTSDPSSFKLLVGGSLGVQIFFVISGFIITMICLDSKNNAKISVGTFISRRFLRIVPIMWIATIIYVAMRYLGTGTFDWGTTWRALVLWPVGQMEFGVLWTLRLEMFFYLLFALVFLVDRRLWPIIVLWILSPIVVRFVDMPPLTSTGQTDDLAWIYLMGHQVGANLQFGLGVLLGLLWNSHHAIFRRSIGGGPWTVAAAALAVLAINELVPALQGHALTALLLTSLTCVLVVYLSILVRPTSGVFSRLSRLLGDASYSIYLFHVLAQLAAGFVLKHVDLGLPTWIVCLAVGVGSVAVGVCIHLFIEKPLLEWLGRPTRSRSKVAAGNQHG